MILSRKVLGLFLPMVILIVAIFTWSNINAQQNLLQQQQKELDKNFVRSSAVLFRESLILEDYPQIQKYSIYLMETHPRILEIEVKNQNSSSIVKQTAKNQSSHSASKFVKDIKIDPLASEILGSLHLKITDEISANYLSETFKINLIHSAILVSLVVLLIHFLLKVTFLSRLNKMISFLNKGELPSQELIEHEADELSLLGKSLHSLKEKTVEQNSQIDEAQNDLAELNKDLTDLNNHLEDSVQKRTNELQSKNEELQKAQETILQSQAMQNQFLANISHEIRNPINSIIGFSELISQISQEQKVRDFSTTILKGGQSLLRLVNDLLDLAKMESNQFQLEYEAASLYEIATVTSNLLQQDFDHKGITLKLNFDENIPSLVCIDAMRLQQVLTNLLSNALKFTQKGEVCLSFLHQQSDSDHSLTITITDTGEGIAKDQQEKIFERFTQQDSQNYRQYGGSGLGLTISKKLIDLMGGTLSLTSELGKGSCFEIKLKLYDHQELPSPQHKEINCDFSAEHILVVDDNPDNALVIKELLQSKNIHVHSARSAKTGLAILEQHNIDLIIMDLMMPEISGLEATKMIRKHNKYKDTPILSFSCDIASQTALEFATLCDGPLKKPLTNQELLQTLQRSLPKS